MAWKLKGIKYLKQERGSILVLVVLLLPIMFGCLGFAYDFGNLYMHRTRLQNVADAAALAGARAYLDSQTTEAPDGIDGTIYSHNKVIGGDGTTIYDEKSRQEYTYVPTSNPNPPSITHGDSKHSKADNAADAYIFKNIINLGTEVKSDEWSHYAINSNGTNPKTFYRIGLSEEVRLYFLPIIKNVPKTQKVRVGAVALVEKGTSSGGGGTSTITHTSVFDNLYTYSYAFDSARSNEQGHTLHTSYSGDMVFTYGDGDPSVFYDMTLNTTNFVDHLFTDTDTSNLQNTGSNSYNWSKVNDPIIDTYFKTTDYIPAFRAKLNAPHGGPKNQSQLTDENINNPNSDLYLVYVTLEGNQVYKEEGESEKLFIPVDNNSTFYAFDDENNDYVYVAGREHTEANRVKYIFVGDSGGKIYAPCITENGRQYLLDENNAMTDSYYENWNIHYGTNSPYTFKAKFADSLQERHQYKKRIVTNVFYVDKKSNGNYAGSVAIEINSAINGTEEELAKNVPIYIIVEDDIQAIDWKVSDNVRPVILVYFGSGEVKIESGTNVKATIYAPYATFPQMHIAGTFYGNIIAKSIYMQASGGGNSWYQDNFLEGKYGYTDSDVATVTQTIKNNIENTEKLPDNIKAEIYNQYAQALNIDVSEIQGDNWYAKQSYENKQKLYGKWKELYGNQKYKQYANQLWPWNEHFEIEPVPTDGTLRLINFRTDFQEKNPDGTVNNGEKDPFIYLSLDGKSY